MESKKRIEKPRTLTAKDMYSFYKRKYPKSKIPYWMFKEVLARHNKFVSESVILGSVFNFGQGLGLLLIKKIKRSYKALLKPEPDWGESKKRKAELIAEGKVPKGPDHPEGEDWLVFFTDPWYLRWAWSKRRICRIRNQTVYKFMPTSNSSKKAGDMSLNKLGNKGKLTLMNRLNPNLHVVYERVKNFD